MHYIIPENRQQFVFMNKLDDMVEERHYVRLIDAFVNYITQGQNELFSSKGMTSIGRKAYHPASLLKLYIYGYLNSISSSRKIERECKRNIEVIWLMGNLVPDHKTIADFRRENTDGINQVFIRLLGFLRDSGYIKGHTIGIDGTKIRANAAMSIDLETISKKLENAEEQMVQYLHQIELADGIDEELDSAFKEKERLLEEISILKRYRDELKREKETLEKQGVKRMSPTDPECRIMKSGQGKHFGYNVQAVIDSENKMITNIAVLSQENDKGQLQPMVEKVEKELGVKPKEVIADAGYYVINQVEYLEKEKNINCYVAINYNQEQTKTQNLGIEFYYQPEQDIYQCAHNGTLIPKHGFKKDSRRGTLAQCYVGVNCKKCSIKKECTESKARSIYRYTNQQWRDACETKMNSNQGKLKLALRKSLSEHPFGTIKNWMGYIPLKTRGKTKVKAEINLYAIAYNLKRLLNIESFEKAIGMFKEKELKFA